MKTGFDNDYSNLGNESQRLLSRTQAISGKENVPFFSAAKSTRKQKNAAFRAQDGQFVADIGQELLVECRKLQLLNAEKDEKLKESDALRSQLEATIENLEARVRHLDESEYRYKEENWNLELKIQEIESDSSEISHRLSKLNLENSRTLQMYTAQVDMLETMQAKHSDLTNELDSWKTRYESEMLNYERVIAELQRDNDALSKSVANLNEQLSSPVYLEPNVVANSERQDEGPEVGDGEVSDDPKTPERSPSLSPVKATPAHRAALEGETLRASLAHAHRTITTLRGAVHREKTEKFELRRLLAEAQDEIESLKNSKGSKRPKVVGAQSTKRTTLLGPNGGRYRYRISNDVDELERDIAWETFNGSSEILASSKELSASETDGFETAHDQPTSDEEIFSDRTEEEDYQTGAESIPAGNPIYADDDDTETESSAISRVISRQRSALSRSNITDDDDEVMGSRILRSTLSRHNLHQKRDSENFGTPVPLFDELGSSPFRTQATPTKATKIDVRNAHVMTDPWEPEIVYVKHEVTAESVMADAAALHMVTISRDVYELLVGRKTTPTTATPDSEPSVAMSEEDERDSHLNRQVTLESVAADAESLSLTILSKAEYESVMNHKPTLQSLEADASALSMVVLPADEYSTASMRLSDTAASLTAAAANLGLVVIAKTDHERLLDDAAKYRALSPETLAAYAESLSLVAIPNVDYNSLINRAVTPESVATDAAQLTAAAKPSSISLNANNGEMEKSSNDYTNVMATSAASLAVDLGTPISRTEDNFKLASFKGSSIYEGDEQSPVGNRQGEVPALSSDKFSGRSEAIAPLLLQAISQTMIGEYLWKYTRRKGRPTLSENRHKRYFWVQPYNRTLYWSNRNPSAGGEIKVKSAPIEGLRVVHDDNPFPPGLYHKSLLILTPTRALKVTCFTQGRHETWFNSLSFLLLRTNSIPTVTAGQGGDMSEDSQVFSNFRFQRSGLGRSNTRQNFQPAPVAQFGVNASTSSYSRTSSSASPRIFNTLEPHFRVANQGSMGRLTSLLRPPTRSLHQSSRHDSEPAQIGVYELHQAVDSTAELQAQMEREAREIEGLENVRACCDGKLFSQLFSDLIRLLTGCR
ncbi:meiotic cell cortex C-terminal pleckstrin homology-domain-containing protein [Lipomyces kononenkoae]|uniref:Meiotic cell cortex C-terminal pleckstrin homology-domain-containing protein n=1 Tax=Lipomyces kononenkoae TaxID=34357 RepID=A0ACC3ST33_LIPKO